MEDKIKEDKWKQRSWVWTASWVWVKRRKHIKFQGYCFGGIGSARAAATRSRKTLS